MSAALDRITATIGVATAAIEAAIARINAAPVPNDAELNALADALDAKTAELNAVLGT